MEQLILNKEELQNLEATVLEIPTRYGITDGGGGAPGGANTQVQFNNSGAFGGSSDFTWNNGSKILTLTGYQNILGDGTSAPQLRVGSYEFQSYSVNNVWMSDNIYWDGSKFTYRTPGQGSQIYYTGGNTRFINFSTGSPGEDANNKSALNAIFRVDGTASIGNVASDGSIGSINTASNGKVGIGTASPSTKLHISNSVGGFGDWGIKITGGSGAGPGIELVTADDSKRWLFTSGANTATDGYFTVFDVTNSSHRLTIDQVGNVGIGSTNPNSKLEVVGTISTSGSSSGLSFYNRATNTFSGAIYSPTEGEIRFFNPITGTDHFVLTDGGYLGVGITTPSSKIHVDNGDIEVNDSANGVILRSPDGSRFRITVNDVGILATTEI